MLIINGLLWGMLKSLVRRIGECFFGIFLCFGLVLILVLFILNFDLVYLEWLFICINVYD